MNTMRCVRCWSEYDATAARCSSCNQPPPWQEGIDSLRDLIKEREVNRGRATLTLIEDVFAAVRDKKPISLASLKGFAFAWLFPRTLIVIGSIVAGATLIVQTVILAQQTRIVSEQTVLLARQSSAARLDQEERLRSRIGLLRELVSDLQRLEAATAAAVRLYRLPSECQKECLDDRALMVIGREATARRLPSSTSFPPANLLKAPSATGAQAAVHNAIDAAGRISEALSAVVVSQPDGEASQPQRQPAATLMRMAQRQCLLPVEHASLFQNALATLEAVRLGRDLLSPDGTRSVQSWISAMSLTGVKLDSKDPLTFLNAGKLTVQDMRRATFNSVDSIEHVSGVAHTLCKKQLAADDVTLKTILSESESVKATGR